MPLSNEILNYATDHIGQQVGNGECWTLAHRAKISAEADTSRDANYIWGVHTSLAGLVAGDIIQFEGYTSVARVDYVTATETGYQEQTSSAPHHTAIVSTILNADQGLVEVVEQNVGGSRRARRGRYYLKSVTYQGELLGRTGTVTITVNGTINLFHAV
jgi:hypothetical protein